MKAYIGTKLVNAKPMTRGEYNIFREWPLPLDENSTDEGFLIEYVGVGQKPNTAQYQGYVSWSPKEVFEESYRPTSKLDFGGALVMLRDGKKVARAGWNGKGMFLLLIDPYHNDQYRIEELPGIVGTPISFIAMKTADNKLVPWLASQTDILAEDWTFVE